jgi:hypothetical protein
LRGDDDGGHGLLLWNGGWVVCAFPGLKSETWGTRWAW